jgi:hypothetical protein
MRSKANDDSDNDGDQPDDARDKDSGTHAMEWSSKQAVLLADLAKRPSI